MNEQHIEGAWQLDPASEAHVVSDDYHVIKAGCGFYAESADREPGFRIAGHMSIADARLLSSARLLLVALERARDLLKEYRIHDELSRDIADIDDAIAAATWGAT